MHFRPHLLLPEILSPAPVLHLGMTPPSPTFLLDDFPSSVAFPGLLETDLQLGKLPDESHLHPGDMVQLDSQWVAGFGEP